MKYYGIIYKVINKINNKIYIGQTIRDIEVRKQEHIKPKKGKVYYFQRAILKYGEYNFTWDIIDYAFSQEELNIKEKCWISIYNSSNEKYGYNLTKGGEFGKIEGLSEIKRIENSKNTNIKNNGKKVININNKMIFKTIKEASEYANVTATAISLCCHGKNKKAGEYTYAFYEDYLNNKKYYDNFKIKNKKSKRIINLSTGEIYDSFKDIINKTGLEYQNISRCCRKKQAIAYDNFWAYYDDYVNDEEYKKCIDSIIKNYKNKNKKVLNIETGEIFKSIIEASIVYNCSHSTISKACQGKLKSAVGFHWKLID